MSDSWTTILSDTRDLADEWRADRAQRQARRALDPADFARLADLGALRMAVPEEAGGMWRSVPESTRSIATVLRTLAAADSSVALVLSMHPAVLGFWLATLDPSNEAWTQQREAIFASAAMDGAQWGTLTSEPGSGGDILKSKATATPTDTASSTVPGDGYTISGAKHFGSGSGVTSFMMTTAVPDGEDAPTIFIMDMRDRPWDGSSGVRLVAEWDGMGMAATQSHAMQLDACPAVRMAWDGPVDQILLAASPLTTCLFTGVVVGILDEAIATAKAQLAPKAETLRAYEQVEWSRAELDYWLAVQAFEGALRAVESGDPMQGAYAGIRAKEAVADLAESCLSRLVRVIGGGSFSRKSPFAAWFEDVRALGFLRPPWGLAYDTLFFSSFLN